MMSRWLGRAIILLSALALAAPCFADCLVDFLSSAARDTKRRNCWPYPFVEADRQAARQPIAAMVGNGWQRQNTVSGMHFEGGELTEGGRLKIQWIVSESPEHRRAIYVRRGMTAAATAQRLRAVEQYLSQAAFAGPLPPVLESNRPEDNWPADRIDLIYRKFQAATPDPKLPAGGATLGGGSGGGGSGGSSSSGGH
jgi:hypothetical protein